MPENLLCPKQIATTPAFREGWDRVFNEEMVNEERRFYKEVWNGGFNDIHPLAYDTEYIREIRRMDEVFGADPVDTFTRKEET